MHQSVLVALLSQELIDICDSSAHSVKSTTLYPELIGESESWALFLIYIFSFPSPSTISLQCTALLSLCTPHWRIPARPLACFRRSLYYHLVDKYVPQLFRVFLNRSASLLYSSAWLTGYEDPMIDTINQRIEDLTGLEMDTAEELQVKQEFMCRRSWTFKCLLNIYFFTRLKLNIDSPEPI